MATTNLHGFALIRDFRVRLPEPLFPYRGKRWIETCHISDLPTGESEWLGIDDLDQFFPSKFSDKNPMNIPGPIYGAETDTCTTGPEEAPQNVLLDAEGQEFIFKQPSNAQEFRDVLSAAIVECFEGYGADGDQNWRLSLIREWWQARNEMLACVNKEFGEERTALSNGEMAYSAHRGATFEFMPSMSKTVEFQMTMTACPIYRDTVVVLWKPK